MKIYTCLILMLFAPFNSLSAQLRMITEPLPPMQIVENGKVVAGLSNEIVEALLKQVGQKSKIEAYNWARVYKIALEHENVLIFSITRYPSREDKFKWVGSIYTLKNYLWRLKSRNDIELTTLEEAKRYRTVVIRKDVQHQHLLNKGFIAPEHLLLTSNLKQSIELLFHQRGDLLVASQTFMPKYF